ncbi:PIN domain-containing protein [uncultured Alsobacter sp.]|uniref:PIN domain-containing protein n=1 Tax=uncultured Alsobacter sp. TaxID=1748258 RepID=UPI0025EAB0CE|nr:PIN domain-containing protein [uncultured Alsobacter sp.]
MKTFFDTNVLVYASQADPKGTVARALLAEGGVVSVQVLNEFVSVSRRKLRRAWPEIETAVGFFLSLLPTPVPLTMETHLAARRLASSHQISFYDALIVAAAIQAGCGRLLSEDLQNGFQLKGLRIENPFLP